MEADELKSMLEGLLKPLNDKIDGLAAENDALKEKLRQNMDLATDTGTPLHLRPAGTAISTGDTRIARSVVVATAPVTDSPLDPMWRDANIVDAGTLVQNSLTKGMKE